MTVSWQSRILELRQAIFIFTKNGLHKDNMENFADVGF